MHLLANRASVGAHTSALKSCRHAAAAPHSTIARPLQRGVAAAAVADSKASQGDTDSGPAYPYNSGDSRQHKATLEHIFKPQDHGDVDVEAAAEAAASTSGRVQAPWAVGWQMNERNIMWSDELKLRLIKRVASQELHITEEELEERLQQVFNLLPDLADRLVKAPPKRVAELASSVDVIAARLLRLREICPKANASALVGNRLTLLLDDDLDEVASAAVRLQALLPGITVDKFVEYYPQVLDVDDFELALQDAKRLMPKMDVAHTLRTNPEMVLMNLKGKHLIPYDPAWPIVNNKPTAQAP